MHCYKCNRQKDMADPVGLDATIAMLRMDHPKGQKIKTNEKF